MIQVSGWDDLWNICIQYYCQHLPSKKPVSYSFRRGCSYRLRGDAPSYFGTSFQKPIRDEDWKIWKYILYDRIIFSLPLTSYFSLSRWNVSSCGLRGVGCGENKIFRTAGWGRSCRIFMAGERILFSEYFENMRARGIYTPVLSGFWGVSQDSMIVWGAKGQKD